MLLDWRNIDLTVEFINDNYRELGTAGYRAVVETLEDIAVPQVMRKERKDVVYWVKHRPS